MKNPIPKTLSLPKHRFSKEITDLLNHEPLHVHGLTLQRWRELGPIDLDYFCANTKHEIDFDMQFIIKEFGNGVFKGQLDENNVEQGIARLQFVSGECENDLFEGFYKDGVFHGIGRYIWADGSYY